MKGAVCQTCWTWQRSAERCSRGSRVCRRDWKRPEAFLSGEACWPGGELCNSCDQRVCNMGFEEKSRLNHAKYTVDDLERPRSSFFGDGNFWLAGLDPNLLPRVNKGKDSVHIEKWESSICKINLQGIQCALKFGTWSQLRAMSMWSQFCSQVPILILPSDHTV